ncbi:DNA (cytosine-5)-methyltransferase 1 [Variovorax paradoxus]|uniref:DNA cytosine methyltransferase n=1 Tax=Variovorax paradoxus TaxID=34073 RepID=UPI002785A851|nr:DNA cytosine methyltransferase [Variovorax paradoxus]MDP9967510.1 DNA (cytosine-5)-methyltransferase 1 [Variovorax paradoxus]
MTRQNEIPVIDLFAGPGGLCEGFSSIVDESGARRFHVKISIEKDPVAHRTLSLRALFRHFPKGKAPTVYYDYVRGKIERKAFLEHPDIREAAAQAANEAKQAELGKTPHDEIDAWIAGALGTSTDWVLIGGPPCQAYSLAGRSRMRGKDVEKFEKDKRHFLYTEYLRIIERFEPAVFVMENVKGMLNSQHGGSPIFDRILADLRNPREGLSYKIRSLVVDKDELAPKDFVIEADDHGVPQSRHRVILFGIRSDVAAATPALAGKPGRFVLKKKAQKVGVSVALEGLPELRSRLSRGLDSREAWLKAVRDTPNHLAYWRNDRRLRVEDAMRRAIARAEWHRTSGAAFIPGHVNFGVGMPAELRSWYSDPQLGGVLQHEARSHMSSDLQRYMFAACFAEVSGYAPNLREFPPKLLPDHGNVDVDAASIPFLDRFRVQVGSLPSSTVVSHIAKDGHYYIHPDAGQCRSLTAREAARLQTFPDNYFFEGNRTEQYHQIGNAVPPLLARKIAEVILDFMDSRGSREGLIGSRRRIAARPSGSGLALACTGR